jgi:Family of unknown function (DUF6356)
MRNIFTRHPSTMNETYFEHLANAGLFGVKMLIGGMACIIHAIFPFLFAKTGTNLLFNMVQDYVCRTPQIEERAHALSEIIQQKKMLCKR